MGWGLQTDLYELTMAASYLRRSMTESATFSLFVRRLPPSRGFLVAAGLDPALAYLEQFGFDDDDLSWLSAQGFPSDVVDAFSRLGFTGDAWAVPEGRVVLAEEPLLEVTAPLPEAQLVETMLLNLITTHTTLATKAARVALAADGRAGIADFSFRRTAGGDAARAAARAAAIAGFAGTSNVAAARELGLAAVGTMAHSYVQAFPSEQAAFAAFAADFPDRPIFLVDTYDTLTGVHHAIAAARAAGAGQRLGIRLDSGDLLTLSRRARDALDVAGLPEALIVASGGLDELRIAALLDAGAPIDVFGVGTNFGVSADAPALDSVYKLVEHAGRPVMKLSSGKATRPGPKQVHRGRSAIEDVLCTRSEPGPPGTRPLLVPVMLGGERVGPPEPLDDARERLAADLAELPDPARRLTEPVAPRPVVSRELARLTESVRTALVASGRR